MSRARGAHRARATVAGLLVALVTGAVGMGALGPAPVRAAGPPGGSWRLTAPLDQCQPDPACMARERHLATLLDNGEVLVVGGIGLAAANSAELYNPVSGSWRPAAPPPSPVSAESTATRLGNGKVLFITSSWLPDRRPQIYDPDNDSWEVVDALPPGIIQWHTATLLDSGKVLVTGLNNMCATNGLPNTGSQTAVVFDPDAPAGTNWGPPIPMSVERLASEARAVRLHDGRVLVIGGDNCTGSGIKPSGAEIYDPATNIFLPTGKPSYEAINSFTLTLLPAGPPSVCGANCGRVLVAGGQQHEGDPNKPRQEAAQLFDPGTGTWAKAPDMSTKRARHTATLLPDGKVLVAGKCCGPDNSAELYDPASGTWSATTSMVQGSGMATATLLPAGPPALCGSACGSVLIVGGRIGYTGEFGAPPPTYPTPLTQLYLPGELPPLPPVLSGIVPDFGPATGARTVTLVGTGFRPGAKVSFGGVERDPVEVRADGTGLAVAIPEHDPGPVQVAVANLTGQASGPQTFTYHPAITAIEPSHGKPEGGELVTIKGKGFGKALPPQTSGVSFGATAARAFVPGVDRPDTAENEADTQLTAVAPAHAPGPVEVVVTSYGLASLPADGIVPLPNIYTFDLPAPLPNPDRDPSTDPPPGDKKDAPPSVPPGGGGTGSAPNAGPQPGSAPQPGPAPQPAPVAQTGPAPQPGPAAQAGPAPQPVPVAQPAPVAQAVHQPGPAARIAPVTQVGSAPSVGLVPSPLAPAAPAPAQAAPTANSGAGARDEKQPRGSTRHAMVDGRRDRQLPLGTALAGAVLTMSMGCALVFGRSSASRRPRARTAC